MSAPGDEEVRAWHEAAHGVVAHALGGRVVSLTMESEEEGLAAAAAIEWSGLSRQELAQCSACTALAGPLAELARFGEDEVAARADVEAWEGDWLEVERCAAALEKDEAQRRERILRWMDKVRSLLDDVRVEDSIARVSDALLAHGSLDETLFADCF